MRGVMELVCFVGASMVATTMAAASIAIGMTVAVTLVSVPPAMLHNKKGVSFDSPLSF